MVLQTNYAVGKYSKNIKKTLKIKLIGDIRLVWMTLSFLPLGRLFSSRTLDSGMCCS